MIAADGTIYVGSLDQSFYAINPADGSQQWAFTADSQIWSTAAVGSDGLIYFGSDSGTLYVLDASGNEQPAAVTTNISIDASPVIDSSGEVYVGSRGGDFFAVSVSSPLGVTAWPMFQADPAHTGRQ